MPFISAHLSSMCIKENIKMISKKERLFNIVAFLSLAISFVAVGVVTFWSIFPYKPLEINNHPYPVLTKEVKQGDVLIFEMDYCKHTDLKGTISRRFVDGLVYVTTNIDTHNEPGCRKQIISEEIPHNLPAGEYVMDFYYTYEMNPIRSVNVHAHTQKFIVSE